MTVTDMKNRGSDDKKVILGLSGGVDSTAAALILQKLGYEVTGLYFNVLDDSCLNCRKNIREGLEKASYAAEKLGIRLIYKDVSLRFSDAVAGRFCEEYAKGRTPNPCIICNPEVKFRTLTETADEENARYIATGHYADTWMDPGSGTWFIKQAENRRKDQSYMLYRLGQDVISRLLLPLSGYVDKEDVRRVVREAGVTDISGEKDSQEICFIDSEDTYADFMMRRGYEMPEGDFVDRDGNVLGKHRGICRYTIGQRKGLGVAVGRPVYVTGIDAEKNTVELGDDRELFSSRVVSSGNILSVFKKNVTAKIRYAAPPARASLTLNSDGTITCEFEQPQRAVTAGQSIVFYDGDIVIGGGFII